MTNTGTTWEAETRAAIEAASLVPPDDTMARLRVEADVMRAIVGRVVWAGGVSKLLCTGYSARLDRAAEWVTFSLTYGAGKLTQGVVDQHAAAFGVPSVVWVWSKDGSTATATWIEQDGGNE